MKPTIAITMGDPAGVGPEVLLRAVADKRVTRCCHPVVLGDGAILRHIARKIGLRGVVSKVIVHNLSYLNPARIKPGRPYISCGRAMVRYVEEAARLAMAGDVDAMVTGPISKEAINRAGCPFPGHTEFLASLTKSKDYAMMLGGRRLKVVLVTIHEPLRVVPRLLTEEKILKTIRITDESFKEYLGFKRPRIAVAALNPHGGEGGLFGDEEVGIIGPAMKRARRLGIDVSGPHPPDTLFHRAAKGKEFDVVVSMYHDQGLIPLKLIHFEDGVNVTLGLPVIRTSVDHGTAYDIAWQGSASPDSMIAAIKMAAMMAGMKAGSEKAKAKTHTTV
ncbi:MAG: 4-hydroxythreonine-4-phosphate dehydrogenase PdxA [Thermodesulfobacteriota bacterium]